MPIWDTDTIGVRIVQCDDGSIELFCGPVDHYGRVDYFDSFDNITLAMDAFKTVLSDKVANVAIASMA